MDDVQRREISLYLGEEIASGRQVRQILSNLGIGNTVPVSLERTAKTPTERGVNPYKYRINDKTLIYKISSVWDYLKNMESAGKIDLTTNSLTGANDLIDKNYHMKGLPEPHGMGKRVHKTAGKSRIYRGVMPK